MKLGIAPLNIPEEDPKHVLSKLHTDACIIAFCFGVPLSISGQGVVLAVQAAMQQLFELPRLHRAGT